MYLDTKNELLIAPDTQTAIAVDQITFLLFLLIHGTILDPGSGVRISTEMRCFSCDVFYLALNINSPIKSNKTMRPDINTKTIVSRSLTL